MKKLFLLFIVLNVVACTSMEREANCIDAAYAGVGVGDEVPDGSRVAEFCKEEEYGF